MVSFIDRRRASARPRHDPRQRGRRDPHRPPLRDAGHGVLRRAGDGARLVRLLQHARRRSTGSLGSSVRGACHRRCSADGPERPLPRRDPRSQPQSAQFPAACPTPTASAEGFNPLCGDRLTLYVRLDGDRISDVSLRGQGCAISVASASLMTESREGQDVATRALALFARVHSLADRRGRRSRRATSASSARCPACASSRRA